MFKDQIKAGAKLLDEKIPEWEGRQDLEYLDLSESCGCVLGQSEDIGEYWTTLKKLFPNAQSQEELYDLAVEHGFNIKIADRHRLTDQEWQDYERLTNEWKKFIGKRRSQE